MNGRRHQDTFFFGKCPEIAGVAIVCVVEVVVEGDFPQLLFHHQQQR